MRNRKSLPQLSNKFFITDGGIETTLIYREGFGLPDFAAFDLLNTDKGYKALSDYFYTYADLAKKYGTGLILESATWRANPDWGAKLGYSFSKLAEANRKAIALLSDIRGKTATDISPMVISGCIGPRGDGYRPSQEMTTQEAKRYHAFQVEVFSLSEADMISAITMNYIEEAIGIVLAAREAGMPVAVSFTVEIDGCLPTGEPLEFAIKEIDLATGSEPAYYMINCAHPEHFKKVLKPGVAWVRRIKGLRANASTKSHAELNEMTELDDGNPAEFAMAYAELKKNLKDLNVFGGCCGTDHRHVEEVCKVLRTLS